MEINIKNVKNNFKNISFLNSYKILEKLYQKQDNYDKKLYIFAGPNGSGKSTLIANLFMLENFDIKYINADIIATQKFSHITDENQKNYQSMFYTMELVQEYISQGKSFCYETVLSHPSKLDIVEKAKENGYKIISVFVCTQSPQINVQRVQKRARQGGHDVPAEKITQRYYRSIENWKTLRILSDEYYEFDNSQEKGEYNETNTTFYSWCRRFVVSCKMYGRAKNNGI